MFFVKSKGNRGVILRWVVQLTLSRVMQIPAHWFGMYTRKRQYCCRSVLGSRYGNAFAGLDKFEFGTVDFA